MVYDKPEPVENLITWVYQEGSFVPSAKMIGEEKFSIINDYIGRPVQAYSDVGELVWETDYDIYGGLRDLKGDRDFIPFRQLGQYEDVETGLYYNRFRYYNPEAGLYLNQDPIELLGNNPNFYAYVSDSNIQIDLFGLNTFQQRLGNFGEDWAKDQLQSSGKYQSVFPVQNASNQGIDLVGLRHDSKFDIFEVKTNIFGDVGKLSDRQLNPNGFIEDVLSNDKAGKGKFGITPQLATQIKNNVGDKRVIDVFVERSANNKWFVKKAMISDWDEIAKVCKK